MNRTTALLLALGLFVAHTLTIQQDPSGTLGTAADRAYAALRLGRNLVHGGAASWTPGAPPADGYPSLAWILLVGLWERLYWPSLWVVQAASAVGALALVIVVSRFSPARLTGVIGPFLMVVSGTLAASALNGTEWTAFALASTVALLAVEERRPRLLVAASTAAVALRPEGVLLLAALAGIDLLRGRDAPRLGPRPFLRAALAALVVLVLRRLVLGVWIPGALVQAATFDADRIATGAAWARGFFLRGGMPLLAVVPLVWVCLRPAGSGRAARCLALAAAWIAWAIWAGGDELPFWSALLPALPPLVIAVQDALTALVDQRLHAARVLGWALFFAGVVSGALASKQHANIGPLPLAALQDAWQGGPEVRVAPGLDVGTTRQGQLEALSRAERLRSLGIFVRDSLPTDATVLSPWPGAVGYLSRKDVRDPFDRVEPGEAGARTASWWGPRRVDLLAAFEERPDFVLPSLQLDQVPAGLGELFEEWVRRYDVAPDDEARRARLVALFSEYVPVAVPIPADSTRPHVDAPEPYVVLRHRRIGDPPKLSLRRVDDGFAVEVQHAGHRLVASLVVELIDAAGDVWSLRPTGTFEHRAGLRARPRLLIYPSGRRSVRLIEGGLPEQVEARELRARLELPRTATSAADLAGAPPGPWGVVLQLERR